MTFSHSDAKIALQKSGLSVAEFARAFGLNARVLYQVINGINQGTRGEGERIAIKLGIKPPTKIKATFKEQLGVRLSQVRTELGETQKKFAERLGITRLSIHKYETGVTGPTVEQLHNLEMSGVDSAYVAFGAPSLANPATRKRFAATYAKVYQESLIHTPNATEEDLINMAWAIFTEESESLQA